MRRMGPFLRWTFGTLAATVVPVAFFLAAVIVGHGSLSDQLAGCGGILLAWLLLAAFVGGLAAL